MMLNSRKINYRSFFEIKLLTIPAFATKAGIKPYKCEAGIKIYRDHECFEFKKKLNKQGLDFGPGRNDLLTI